ncbi:MAG: hypothetical protein QXK94_08650 [Candidatus Jordarchaeales archaeon]
MFEAVVKVGGSLTRSKRVFTRLCSTLSELGKRHRLLFIPGGGSFADEVREAYKRFGLSETTAHWMALMAMNQFGLMLAELIGVEAVEFITHDRTVVLLPFKLIFEEDPLPHSWEATSDSVATYIACKIHAPKLVLLKDVDGVFSADPKKSSDARLLENLKAEDLLSLGIPTCVDPVSPRILTRCKVEAWVINGKHPERLAELLSKGKTIGTRIC